MLAVSGCTENDGNDINASSPADVGMISASSLGDINSALEDGPVLAMIGFDSCPGCKVQKPIMEDISLEYQDRATVIYIDTQKVGTLGFSVYYVPDSFVITDIENGTYVYMRRDGRTTTDRLEKDARFIGVTRKADLTQTLDYALKERSKNTAEN
ncbi:MAG: thioredoxin family protein [Methanolobus sp.]|uniref:thioredoxin family protein n=1 Tax=Methanolobus sp. TaxID=1874737 RepID=UPI00273149BB|nr:thioredoxin family protein [Methanolobus sp.]MDP2217525.1 thioredoxin family protein [Methanolobus sp.]